MEQIADLNIGITVVAVAHLAALAKKRVGFIEEIRLIITHFGTRTEAARTRQVFFFSFDPAAYGLSPTLTLATHVTA